jgi:hypothetical protein
MNKFGLIAVIGAALALAACGSSTKTVTLTTSSPSGTPSSGGAAGTTGVPASVIACFQSAGATVRGPVAAGRASAIHVTTPDGGALGYVKAPTTVVYTHVAQVFASSGAKVKPVTGNPTAFAFSRGTVTTADVALLSKCAK